MARVILSAEADWAQVQWIEEVPMEQFLGDLRWLGEVLLLGV